MSVFLRTPYNYDADVASFKSGLDCSGDPSLAQQHMRDECDINVMVQRFARIGELPPAPPAPALADFDEVYDFQSAMNVVVQAERSFAALPANVRKRFDNDPAQMMAFLNEQSNFDEAVSLGLVDKPVVVVPPVMDDPPSDS